MHVKELKTIFSQGLAEIYPKTEITSFLQLLTEAYLGMNRLQVALNPALELNSVQVQQFEKGLKRLQNQEPIQYILGETEFFGYRFLVNPVVLIPRPETEELVEWIIQDLQHFTLKKATPALKIVDVGTGSGCIPISLAKELPQAKFTALDISSEALAVARQNAKMQEVEVGFIQQDILAVEELPETYDVIVSNPPYVRQSEKKQMHKNVLDYEPNTALYVSDEDPLLFYRKIAQLAHQKLAKDGALYFEINQYLAEELKQVLEKQGFKKITLKKDSFGNYRMCKASC